MSFNLGSAHGEIVIDYNGAAVQQAIGDLGRLQGAGDQLTKIGGTMLGIGAAIGAPLVGATNAAADFEFQMDAVNAALGGVDASAMQEVEEQALAMGAATKFSAGEVAGAMEALGKSGLTQQEITGGATQAVLDLAAASGESLVPSAQAAAAAINLFNLDAQETAAVADIFTAGLNNSAAALPDFQRGVTTLGSSMANLNQYANDGEAALRDTAAAVAYFNSQGLKAADAGVSLARGLENLATPTSDASIRMAELGIAAFDAQGNFIGFPALMDQLQTGLEGTSDAFREQTLSMLFGQEAVDVMNKAVKAGGDPLREMQALLESNGQAAEQAAIRQDNLRGTLEELGGAVQTAAIALGQPLLDPIRGAAEALKGLVQGFIGLDPEVQTFIASMGALSAILLTVGGGTLLAAGQVLKLAAAFQSAGLSLGKFVLGLGLVGVALAAGVLAYQTNFLGFADKVDAALAKTQKTLKAFGAGFKAAFARGQVAGLNDVANAVQAFGDALLFATGIDVTPWTDKLSAGIQAFGDAIQENATNQVPMLVSALDALGAAADAMGFEGVGEQLQNAALAMQQFGDTFQRVSDINKDAGFNDVAAGISAAGVAIDELLGTDLAPYFDAAAKAVQVFGTSFATARAEGLDPFTAAAVALRDALTQLTGIDLVPTFDAITDFISALQQGDFATAGQMLADVAQTIGDGLSGVAVQLTDWVLNVAAPAVMNFIGDASQWIFEQLNALGTTIDNFTNWVLNVGLPAAGQLVGDFVTWLQGKLAALAPVIDDFTNWILNVGLPAAGQFVGDLAGWIKEKLEGAGIAISDFTGWSLSLGLPSGGGNAAQAGLGGTGVSGADFTGFINDALVAAAIAVENFTGWNLTITTPEGGVQVDGAAIEAAIREALTVDLSVVDMAREIGGDLGSQAGALFWQGFVDLFNQFSGTGGGGGGTAAGMASGAGFGAGMGPSIGDAVLAFFASFKEQFMLAVDAGIDQAVADINSALEAKKTEFWNGILDALRGMFDFVTGTQTAQAAPTDSIDPGQLGTDMGTQFGEVFKSPEFAAGFEEALDTLPASTFAGVASGMLTKISDAIGTAMQAQGPGAVSETGQGTSPIGGDMGTALVTSIATGLQTAIDAAPIEQFAAIGQSLVVKIQDAISAAMTTAGTGGQTGRVGEGAVGGLGAGLVSSLATSIASSITAAPIEAFAAIGTALQTKISEVLATAMQAGAGKGTPQAGLGGTGGGAGIGQSIAQSIADAISGADFASVATALKTALTMPIQTALTQVGTTIATAVAQWSMEFSNGFTNIVTVVTNGMTTVTNAITTGMTAAQTAVTTAISAMTADFEQFATAAEAAGQQAGDGFNQGITAGLQAAQAAAQAAVDAIIGILNSAADGAYAAGEAVGEGFAAGMEASLGRVQAAAAAMADAAAEGLAAAAQIASPSKVSMALGEQFGAGFQLGIAGAAPNAAQASFNMGQESIRALADSLRANAEAKRSRLSSLGDDIRERFGQTERESQPMTIETTGTVEMDGQAMGTFSVETVLGSVVGASRKGGKRRGRML
jgi:TP901 family phage tail tape measure protein